MISAQLDLPSFEMPNYGAEFAHRVRSVAALAVGRVAYAIVYLTVLAASLTGPATLVALFRWWVAPFLFG